MFSRKDDKLLEEQTAEPCYGAISKTSSTTSSEGRTETGNPAFIASSPAILEPSKDAPRPQKEQKQEIEDSSSPPINPWRTLVTCSCPVQSTRVLVSAEDESNDRADEQHGIHEQSIEHLTTCSSFLLGYKNFASELRNSKFIYFFQVMLSLISLSAVVMGILFNADCPAARLLTSFDAITGIIGVIFSGLWMSMTRFQRLGEQSSVEHRFAFVLFTSSFCLFTTIEMGALGTMSPNFGDEYSPNYCNETFYSYFVSQQTAMGAAAVLSLILYLPGCLHYCHCHCFSRSASGIDQ